jgi:hypothetical protein
MVSQFSKRIGLHSLVAIPLTAWSLLGGCGNGNRQISTAEFYGRAPAGSAPLAWNDQPGALPIGHTETQPPRPIDPEEGHPRVDTPSIMSGASTTLPTEAPPATAPSEPTQEASVPATQPSLISGDQYLDLGAVVVEVNGKPIFISNVLRPDAFFLRQKAREMDDFDQFRTFVAGVPDQNGRRTNSRLETDIQRQVNDELLVAEANNRLSQSDKDAAKYYTEQWKIDLVHKAGGSLEVARRLALSNFDVTLEEAVEEKYRFYLTQFFLEKYIYNRADVTAAEMRAYYESHKNDSNISTPDRAEAYIIQTNPSDLGAELAHSKLEDYRKRALAGADFGVMAHDYNSDGPFKGKYTGGPGSLRYEKVDAAIWKLDPGQVSDIIEDSGKLFLVKVVSREKGIVHPFEDQEIQDTIRNVLITQKRQVLSEAENQKLESFGSVVVYADGEQAALNVVLQNYKRWREEK